MDKKISVMIVDDERFAIEDLSTLVNWNDLGFEIVATAFNGSQALIKYETYHPQVVFTDVKMPFMDGIELIGRLRKLNPDVQLILLTAFEDFGYARSAIQQGITDYLVKSEINQASLTNVLEKIAKTVRQKNQYQIMLTDKCVESFFWSREATESPEEKLLLSGSYFFLLFEQDEPIMLSGEMVSDFRKVSGSAMAEVIRRQDYGQMELVAASVLPKQRTLACLSTDNVSVASMQSWIYQMAGSARKALEAESGYSFTVYASEQSMTFYELKSILRNDDFLLGKKYFHIAEEPIALKREIAARQENSTIDIQPVVQAFKNEDAEEINAALDQIYDEICRNQRQRQLCMVSQDLYYLLCNSTKSFGTGENVDVDLSPDQNWGEWMDAASIRKWMKAKFSKLLELQQKDSSMGYSRPVNDAIAFINENYSDPDLSLKKIADQLHLSVGYLCAMFKQETGVTLKNYITDVRIEKAKKLLESDYMKIYEICEATGYQSSQYFSQVFYKKVGVYPAEYRKRGHLKNEA